MEADERGRREDDGDEVIRAVAVRVEGEPDDTSPEAGGEPPRRVYYVGGPRHGCGCLSAGCLVILLAVLYIFFRGCASLFS